MKLEISVTLEEGVVAAVEKAALDGESRSQVMERLLRRSLATRERAATDARDSDILNAHGDEFNDGAADVLGYVMPSEER